MDQMVITYKYRMTPSRKNVGWVGGGHRCNLGSIRPSNAGGRSSCFSNNRSPPWVGVCGWLSYWTPFSPFTRCALFIGVGFFFCLWALWCPGHLLPHLTQFQSMGFAGFVECFWTLPCQFSFWGGLHLFSP